jgi:hypothetical protein
MFYKHRVMPFVSNLVAFLPPQSADKLLALREAGKISLAKGKVTTINANDLSAPVSVERIDPEVGSTKDSYELFVDCSGQKAVSLSEFPFQSLVKQGVVKKATNHFRSEDAAKSYARKNPREVLSSPEGGYEYLADGIEVDSSYRIIGENGMANPRVFDIAHAHFIGQKPYFPGLQQCNDMGEIVAKELMSSLRERKQLTHVERLARSFENFNSSEKLNSYGK